jgi:hypothetical protein
MATTESILDAAFGKPNGGWHDLRKNFDWAGAYSVQRPGFSGRGGTPEHVIQQQHQQPLLQKKAVLESAVEQLQMLQPTVPRPAQQQTPTGLHPHIEARCGALYASGAFAEAVEKSFKVVRDRLRELTGYEKGSEAFGKGRIHIRGAAAPHVDSDFNEGAKFLMMPLTCSGTKKATPRMQRSVARFALSNT